MVGLSPARQGILCQGRGSAANSVVCFALGVTSVSPEIGTMVFERFVSEARDEPPDIDVDFEHERREEVIQYIYRRYGRERAGLCATVIHYRGKRAIREVGRGHGAVARHGGGAVLARSGAGASVEPAARAAASSSGSTPTDRRLALTMALVDEIIGFPRHLSASTSAASSSPRGGSTSWCRSRTRRWRTAPSSAGTRTTSTRSASSRSTCWRSACSPASARPSSCIAEHHGTRYTLATLPAEDPAVYDMLCRADSLGVFQVESRAQMSFLPRMRPRCFYDLVIEVAIVRPGPIQGDMVHPYLRRRRGEEKVEFPSDALGEVLGKTLGVPLFQEQAMQIAIIGAGFTPEEADRLRRVARHLQERPAPSTPSASASSPAWRRTAIRAEFAERCFSQIEGFGAYGFPESHAASFALLVYASAWLKCHHPAVFACALLNSQPMGFYAPAQIVRDAREHGVEVRPVCVNASYWDNALEPDGRGGLALRLGFRQIKAMREDEADWIAAARGNGYRDVGAVWRRAGTPPRLLARARRGGRLREPRADPARGALAGAGDRRRGAAAALRRARGRGRRRGRRRCRR